MVALIIIYIVEAAFIGLFRGNTTSSRTMAIGAVFLFSLFFMLFVQRNKRISKYTTPFILGYYFRVFLLFFDLYGKTIYRLPNSGADTELYFHSAINFSQYGAAGRGGIFSQVTGTIMKLSGTDRLFPQFSVVLFAMIAIRYMIFTLDLFDDLDEQAKKRAVYLVCLLPNFAILSSIFLRESSVTMFLSISLYCFFRWVKEKKSMFFILAFVSCMIGAVYHSGSVGVAIGYIGVLMLYDPKREKLKLSFKRIIPAMLLLAGMAVLYTSYGGLFFSKMDNLEEISDIANISDLGGSSYARYVGNSNSIASLIIFTIPRIVFFLLSPLPFQWRGLSDIIAFLFSSLFFAIVTFRAVKTLIGRGARHNDIVMLVIITAVIVLVFAWGVSNTGTAVRHRDKLITLFGVLYALTYPTKKIVRRG